MTVFRSRWGWHPCDYQTYLLLKRLNNLYEKAVHAAAAWQRWARKKPSNRVIRRYARNGRGQKIGSEVVGPMPEPRLCPLFCAKSYLVGQRSPEGHPVPCVKFHFPWNVAEVYRAARKPVSSPEAVKSLPWAAEEIRQFIAQAEEWC
jgi:hypothetical protein